MTTYTDISLSIQRNAIISPGLFSRKISPHTVYFKLYRRRWNRPFLHVLTPDRCRAKPEWLCDEDYSRATLVFLKVFISWHNGNFHRHKLSPWNLVVFPSNSAVSLPDDAKLVDIANGLYGPNSQESPLVIVHKDPPNKPVFSFGRLFGRRKEEHRVVEEQMDGKS